jgi:hypothetical protein
MVQKSILVPVCKRSEYKEKVAMYSSFNVGWCEMRNSVTGEWIPEKRRDLKDMRTPDSEERVGERLLNVDVDEDVCRSHGRM